MSNRTRESPPADYALRVPSAVQPVVEVRALQKRFVRSGGEEVRAIDDVTFDIAAGEFVVLLGPSGCGKTTLLRAVAGLEAPDGGEIRLHGNLVFSGAPKVNVPPDKRNVSMVFQSYALWPHMTVFANVAYPLTARRGTRSDAGEVGERVHRVLAQVGIPGLGDQYPNQLSGGQQQRVALARALVVDSSLVLFDEPLSNVDAKVREQLRLELVTMQKELGFSALFVTHDQTEAMVLADRVAVLDAGKIAQIAPAPDVYHRPISRYVANFIGTTNEVRGQVATKTSGRQIVIDTDLGAIHAVTDNDAVRVGDEVVAVWRPELCSLGERAHGVNTWDGEVVTSIFHGAHTEHLVDVSGHRFIVWQSGALPLSDGAAVRVQVEAAAVRVLPVDSAYGDGVSL